MAVPGPRVPAQFTTTDWVLATPAKDADAVNGASAWTDLTWAFNSTGSSVHFDVWLEIDNESGDTVWLDNTRVTIS